MSDDLHHLAAAYALDALDAAERAAFEAHYPTCEICADEVTGFRATAAVLAEGVAEPPTAASAAGSSAAVPASVKADVMAAVARTRQISPLGTDDDTDTGGAEVEYRGADPADEVGARRDRRGVGALAATAVAAVVLLVVGAFVVLQADSGSDGVTEVVAASDAVVTSLTGDAGVVQVVWSPDRGEVAVLGNGLADPGPGLVYELWFLVDDGAAPAGLFEPDRDNAVRTVLAVDDIEGDGWGITIEPEGGSEQPTGDVLFAGEIV